MGKIRVFDYKYTANVQGTVIGVTQPPPRDGAWSSFFSNLSKSAFDNYSTQCSKSIGRGWHNLINRLNIVPFHWNLTVSVLTIYKSDRKCKKVQIGSVTPLHRSVCPVLACTVIRDCTFARDGSLIWVYIWGTLKVAVSKYRIPSNNICTPKICYPKRE